MMPLTVKINVALYVRKLTAKVLKASSKIPKTTELQSGMHVVHVTEVRANILSYRILGIFRIGKFWRK